MLGALRERRRLLAERTRALHGRRLSAPRSLVTARYAGPRGLEADFAPESLRTADAHFQEPSRRVTFGDIDRELFREF